MNVSRLIYRFSVLLAALVLLAGCLGTVEETFEQAEAEAVGDVYQPAEIQTSEVSPIDAQPTVRASTAASIARLGIAPIDGIPQALNVRLSESIRRSAFRRNMFLVPNGDRAQTHIVKGYLSLAPNALGTVVVYIWDVSANDGTPAYRISGQVLAPNSDGSWASIDSRTIDTVAVQSMEAIISWLNQQSAHLQQDNREIVPFQ